jgi:hypothetical protein
MKQRKLQRADTILYIVVKHVILISNSAYRKLTNLYSPSEVVIVCGREDNTWVVLRHYLSWASSGFCQQLLPVGKGTRAANCMTLQCGRNTNTGVLIVKTHLVRH